MSTTTTTATLADQIAIESIDAITLRVPIVGNSPLIVHNFSEKSKRQMLEAQQGKKKIKEIRDPEAEYQASFYRINDPITGETGYGFPVTAFKAATIGAARFYGKSLTMTSLRQFLFMRGILTDADPQQLVKIEGTPRQREDVVRLGGPSRSADLRYRAEFPTWSATLEVMFIKSSISQGSVLSLIDAGGMGIGVGEWRPEKRGEFGTYGIDKTRQVEVID
ncbi:hypothetical protein [Gryllotalpicola protaetiae]|uniref:Uncharacterized protein n=1 Tax=Gryllotalpicola protaetiae TaxID=2419771 RepID=A0A387BJF5_9MICO|nr:hypothetical protein [Gryllotalpicola protaetiae]AYG02382.1 hypothetical protein D7I44_01755 [Gryllotalpicola protaetiae]